MLKHKAGLSAVLIFLSRTPTGRLAGGADDAPATQAATAPDFNTHIAPLFKKYCLGCHNANDAEHGLVLESYEGLLKGGDGGAVVVPGKSDVSRLLLVL